MKHAKQMMGLLVMALTLSLTVTVWAAETQKKVNLSSHDGLTKGEGTLTAVWAWFEEDAGVATTIITAESQDIAKGAFVSLFGYQNCDLVCSDLMYRDIEADVTVRGNCDVFKSYHTLTVNGSSTTPISPQVKQTLEYWN